MQNEIVIIGSLVQHTILSPNLPPVIGIPGGYALYAAAGARLWHHKVNILSGVGENYPRAWLDSFAKNGIDCEGVRVLPGFIDHRVFIAYTEKFISSHDKPISRFLERGFEFPKELFNYKPPVEQTRLLDLHNKTFPKPAVIPFESRYPNAVLIGPMGYEAQFQLVNYYRANGVRNIAVHIDSSYVDPRFLPRIQALLESVQTVFVQEGHLTSLFRGHRMTRWGMLQQIASWDIENIIVLRPLNHQMLYIRSTQEKWIIPAYDSPIVDPTGHEAAFCGAFLSYLQQSSDPIRSAICGNVAGSICMETVGFEAMLGSMQQLIDMRANTLQERLYKVD